jgi:Rifampin ADP-ribosyl transferase
MRARLRLYHGGVAGLVPGQKLLPPLLTDACSCADHDGEHCRTDRVYLTTDAEEAAVYAALTAPGGGGDVYEVEPIGELEPDPAAAPGTGSYATPAATVVSVIRRDVSAEEAARADARLPSDTREGRASRSTDQLNYCISVEELI